MCASATALWIAVLAGCIGSGDITSSSGAAFQGDDWDGAPADAVLDAVHSDLQSADSTRHGSCASLGFPLRIPTGCGRDAATGRFVCAPEMGADGLTRTRGYQFLDAAGEAQPGYDSLATEAIRFESTVRGTRTRRGRTTSIDDRRELTVSGLSGHETTRTWNGTGTSRRRHSVASSVRTVESISAVTGVVIPAPWARDSWPLSGRITTRLVSSTGAELTSEIAFNGTRYATLRVGERLATIDLARGRFTDVRGWGRRP